MLGPSPELFLQFSTIYYEINKSYDHDNNSAPRELCFRKPQNMANNKYGTIIIIFIRGFGLLNLLSSELSLSRPRDGIFYWPI